jgi:hypothetical protein
MGKDVRKCGEGESFRGRKDKVELEQKYRKEREGREVPLYKEITRKEYVRRKSEGIKKRLIL